VQKLGTREVAILAAGALALWALIFSAGAAILELGTQ
jgi:hypothetical protein